METDEQLTAWRDQHQAWQRDTIRRHGWAVTAVLGDDHEPPFAYTVGLSGFGHPELVVFGLLQAVSGRLLNGARGSRGIPGSRSRAGCSH